MTAPWYPSPNPGGQNRKLVRYAIAEWIEAQRIQGLDTVHRTDPGPDKIQWDDAALSTGDYHAQLTVALPSDDEDRLAYTGPTDPGGKLVHYSVELGLYHLGGEPDSWLESEDDYDRIVERLKDAVRGRGRDLGRPDVILQVGEYPRTSGISTDHEPAVAVAGAGGIFRRGTIRFTVSQYLPMTEDQ